METDIQERTEAPRLRLGSTAPDFEAEGTIRFHEWIGEGWAVLFSHPKDFTPVCTTELGTMAKAKPEFDRRGVKIIGLSVDPLDRKEAWADDIEATTGGRPNFPIIADSDFTVAKLYGRTTSRPPPAGNFDEILRVIDSLQLTAKHKVATPANWQQGDDVIIAGSVSDEAAKELWPEGWETPLPYMRVVPQPSDG